jgi:hypothetical protein
VRWVFAVEKHNSNCQLDTGYHIPELPIKERKLPKAVVSGPCAVFAETDSEKKKKNRRERRE